MTIGETLKRARKKMNLELDEVAEKTKIAKMFLIALENDDITSLPRGVYTRNFLRTYAKFLQLDEDIITAEYHEQYDVTPQFVAHQEQTKHDDLQFRRVRRRYLLVTALAVAVLGAGIYYFYPQYRDQITEFFADFEMSTPGEPNQRVGDRAGDPSSPTGSPEQEPPAADSGAGPTMPAGPEETSFQDLEPAAMPVSEQVSAEEKTGASNLEVTDPGGGVPDPLDSPTTSADEPPVAVEPSPSQPYLPVTDLSGIQWTPSRLAADHLENMFALQGKGEVWIEVIIDDVQVTQRFLQDGQVRFYRYGAKNSVIIGDLSRISIQDGAVFRDQLSQRALTLTLRDFGPGGLLDAIDARLVNNRLRE